MSAETAEILSPLVRDFVAGGLWFKRTGPSSRDPNHWEIVEA